MTYHKKRQLTLQNGTILIIAIQDIFNLAEVTTKRAGFDSTTFSAKKMLSIHFTQDLQEELATIKKRLDEITLIRTKTISRLC